MVAKSLPRSCVATGLKLHKGWIPAAQGSRGRDVKQPGIVMHVHVHGRAKRHTWPLKIFTHFIVAGGYVAR